MEKRIKEIIQFPEPEKKSKLLSRNQVAEYLHISLPTLNEWTKLGWLKSYKIGNRVLYKSDEVDKGLRERKYSRL
jgi:excisionase family DNA binding protein